MMLTDLKTKLTGCLAQRHDLPWDGDPFGFVDEHLDLLGSLDSELRDSLFYEAVDGWIGQGRLSPPQLHGLAGRLVSRDFLSRGLGEPCGGNVFRRTFSCLVLDSIVRRLNTLKDPQRECIESIAGSMECYVREERDLRGYVVPHGWAHAVAHAADVLASLAASPHLPGAWDDRLLGMVKTLLLKSPEVYTHQEDKRLARVVRNVRACRSTDLEPWIESLLAECPGSFSDMAAYARRTNLLDFLRALYFHLRVDPAGGSLAAQVEVQVRTLMRIG